MWLSRFYKPTNLSYGATRNARSFSTGAPLPAFLTNIPETKVTTLSNGMKVATETNNNRTATIGVYINTGSTVETPQNNGTAHFLEHMAFKGTQRRSQRDIEVEVENMGASLNAHTSREHTAFYAKVFQNDVGASVDLLADILQNSKLENADIEKERSVILTEMQEVHKNKEELAFDYLHSVAFSDSPLGLTILGPTNNIKSITREDLQQYINTHYTADRMVLVGAGGVNHEELVSLAEKHFTSLPSTSSVDFSTLAPVRYTGAAVTHHDRDMKDCHVVLAYEGASWTSPDHIPIMVIQSIVGAWDKSMGAGKNVSSALGEKAATHNLVNSFTAFNTCYNESGLFGTYLVAPPDGLEDTTCAFVSEFTRIGFEATDAEVERAKNKLKASLLMSLNGNTSTFEEIGRQLFSFGRRVTPAELFKRIDAVNTDTIRRVAEKYCHDACPAAVCIGDTIEFPEYNTIRGWTNWNRL